MAGRLQGERHLEMKRSRKSENTRAEVKISTRGLERKLGKPPRKSKRGKQEREDRSRTFQNPTSGYEGVQRGSRSRGGGGPGGARGTGWSPKKEAHTLPAPRGLAPLPAQQELREPEPLAETPPPTHPWASREGASQTPKESSVQVRVWLQTQPPSTTRTPFCPC